MCSTVVDEAPLDVVRAYDGDLIDACDVLDAQGCGLWSDAADVVDPQWSWALGDVDEVLAEVALFGTGAQAVALLESLQGRVLSDVQQLAVCVGWERASRWVSARSQLANVAFVGPDPDVALRAALAGSVPVSIAGEQEQEAGVDTLSPAGAGGVGKAARAAALAVHRAAVREQTSRVLELALGLDCSDVLVKARLRNGRLLAGTLSASAQRLSSGELSEYRVRRICEKLDGLPGEVARDIEARVLVNAGSIKLGSMTAKLRRLVLAAKGPDAAREHREGARNRRVFLDTEPAEPGLLGVHAYLPAEVAVAVRETLERLQGELAKADRVKSEQSKAARRAWERRRRASEHGVPHHQAQVAAGGTGSSGSSEGAPSDDGDRGHLPDGTAAAMCRGPEPSDPASAPTGDGPGGVSGGVPGDGCGCGGADCGSDRPPAVFARRTKDQRLADALALLVLGPDEDDPSVPARPRFLLQLTMSLPVLLALRAGAAELPGYGPVPADLAREWATDAAWQRFVHEPVTGHLLDIGTVRHDHPAAMRAFCTARDVHDRFPTGNRQARYADLDHIREHHPDGTGGPTSSANTACTARIGHIAKTHNGWTVTGNANDVLTWHSPHGLTFPSHPHDYSDGPEDPGPPPF